MLSHQNRLSSRNVATIFKTARPAGGAFFVIRHIPEGTIARFAIIAPKTIANTAVLRNSLRRKWYGSVGEILKISAPKPGMYAVILKKEAILLTPEERKSALLAALKRYI